MTEPVTDPLLELIEMLKALPEDLQREAAERIRPIVEEFDERYWDRQFADPRSEAFFAEVIEEARRDPWLPWLSPEEAGVADQLDAEDRSRLG